jgi:hypothetical protein
LLDSASRTEIFDVDLDRTRRPVRRGLEGFFGLVELKAMSNEWLQINHSMLDESDRNRPRVMIAINEFQISLQQG